MPKKTPEFWSDGAKGYTETILGELEQGMRQRWRDLIVSKLPAGKPLSILDAGCGPGYFSILLSKEGHNVTAIDFSDGMLQEAEHNISGFGDPEKVTLLKMDAQNPDFPPTSFDCIITRSMTWMFSDLECVYANWLKLLKPGGCILLFDCNWFLYCFDPVLFEQDEKDLQAAVAIGYPYADVSRVYTMDRLPDLQELPLSLEKRPDWDAEVLRRLGCKSIEIIESLPSEFRYGYYAVRYAHIPYFMICVTAE